MQCDLQRFKIRSLIVQLLLLIFEPSNVVVKRLDALDCNEVLLLHLMNLLHLLTDISLGFQKPLFKVAHGPAQCLMQSLFLREVCVNLVLIKTQCRESLLEWFDAAKKLCIFTLHQIDFHRLQP